MSFQKGRFVDPAFHLPCQLYISQKMVEIQSVEKTEEQITSLPMIGVPQVFLLRVFYRFYSIFTQNLTEEYNLTTKKNLY